MPKELTHTTEFKGDISDLQKAITSANKSIKLAQSEFKAANDSSKEWGTSLDGLQAKHKLLQSVLDAQQKKMDSYNAQLALTADHYGENSDQVTDLKIKMNNLQGEMNKTEAELKSTDQQLGSLADSEEAAGAAAKELGGNAKDGSKEVSDMGKDADKAGKSVDGLGEEARDSGKGVHELGNQSDKGKKSVNELGEESKKASRLVDGLAEAAKKAGSVVASSLGSAITGAMKGLGGLATAAGGAAVAVAGIALSKGFERLENIDTAKAKLEALKLTTEEVNSIMDSASEAVTGTAFSLDQAATAAGNAKAAGVDLGEMEGYLSRIANTAAIAGKDMGEMSSVINKVQTSGKATNRELKQLADMGLPIYQWLGEAAGKSADDIFNAAKKGEISSAMLYEAIDKNVGGAAKTMGELSIAAAKDNFFAALSRAGAAFLNTGGEYGSFFDMFKSGIVDMTAVVKELKEPAAAAGKALSDLFGPVVQDTMTEISNAILNLNGDFTKLPEAFSQVLTKMIESISTIIPGLVSKATEFIETFLNSLKDSLPVLIIAGKELILSLVKGISTVGPLLFDAAVEIVTSLLRGLADSLPDLIPAIKNGIMDMLKTIQDNVGDFVNAAVDLIVGLAEGIGIAAPDLIDSIIEALLALVQAIIDNLDIMLDAGLKLILGLAQGLIDAIPKLLDKLPEIINSLVEFIITNGREMAAAGIVLLTSIVKELPTIIKGLVDAIPKIIIGLVNALTDPDSLQSMMEAGIDLITSLITELPKIILEIVTIVPKIVLELFKSFTSPESTKRIMDGGYQLITSLVAKIGEAAAKIAEAIPEVIAAIKEKIISFVDDIKETGKNLILGLASGIRAAIDTVKGAIGDVVNGAINFGKSLLGISSPSKVFMEIGERTGEGFAIGLSNSLDEAKDALQEKLNFDAGEVRADLAGQVGDIQIQGKADRTLVNAIRDLTETIQNSFRAGDNYELSINGLSIEPESDVGEAFAALSELLLRKNRMGVFA